MNESRRPSGSPRRWFRDQPVLVAVVVVTLVGLLARLHDVGHRVAHWDEARVAHWALRYAETGTYEYRPITHGPFLEIVNGTVFGLLGASDVTARLVLVLVGGLLPLAALYLRTYLSDVEVVAVAVLLAFDPVMLYYSRFMRNDVLLGAFALVAFVLFVRAATTRRVPYLYGGALLLGLAFTTKENALVYVLCWVGAGTLVVGEALLRRRLGHGDQAPNHEDQTPGHEDQTPGHGNPTRSQAKPALGHVADEVDRLRRAVGGWRGPSTDRARAARWGGHAVGATVVFLVVLVFFYAPRGAAATVEMSTALTRPTALPTIVSQALLEYFPQGYEYWADGVGDDDEGLLEGVAEPGTNFLRTLALGSGVVLALSVLGFVHERRAAAPRALVLAASYWGYVSILGYPFAASVERPAWLVVHVVVPLSIPAAVGAGVVYQWAREAHREGNVVELALVALVVLAAAGGLFWVGYDTSYANPQAENNVMVQFAQPSGEMRGTLEAMEEASRANEGLDVLYYGERYYLEDEGVADRAPAGAGPWYDRLPLPWYTAAFGAEVSSEQDPAGLEEALAEEPPIVIADGAAYEDVDERVEDYHARVYDLRGPGGQQYVVIYVHRDYTG